MYNICPSVRDHGIGADTKHNDIERVGGALALGLRMSLDVAVIVDEDFHPVEAAPKRAAYAGDNVQHVGASRIDLGKIVENGHNNFQAPH